MSSVEQHYRTLLAPVYLWMAGGIEHALAEGAADVAGLAAAGATVVDLGAGFGMHSIPLARAGCKVFAIDSSRYLLEQLRAFGSGLAIETAVADLLRFPEHLPQEMKADLILCMGDTLTHLPNPDAVVTLARLVAAQLAPGGRFVATFRDYTVLPTGEARFIPVRSDPDRIHTCFLEDHGESVRVHDILHERRGDAWTMRVGSYLKLRIAPKAVRCAFAAALPGTSIAPAARGMLKLLAEK